VLHTIGRTRLVPLRYIVPKESARILVKLEYENSTGSMKDRMALEAVRVVAVEPEESAELSGRPSGSHKIEATGAGFIVPLWSDDLADEIQIVSSHEAMATARRLALLEGIFAGTSTGGNVAVAMRVAERLGTGRTVVTVAVESGMKYLSTELYARA
jgi:cysteine synthase